MIRTIDDQLRLDLLREALPYIQRFKGQTFVVKLSGKATEDHSNLISLAEELARRVNSIEFQPSKGFLKDQRQPKRSTSPQLARATQK